MKQKIRQKDLDEGLKSFVSVLKLSSRELKKKPTNPHTHHSGIPERGTDVRAFIAVIFQLWGKSRRV